MCRHKSSEIAAGFGRTQIPRNLSYSSHIPGVQQENTHTNKRFKSFQHTFTLCDLLWCAHFTWRTQQHLPGHPPPPHVPLAPFRDLPGVRGCCGALRMGLHGECCAQSLLLVPSSSGTQAQLRAGVGKGQQPLCRCGEGSCATGEGPSCSAHGGEGSGTAGGKWAGGMRYTRAVLINS